MTKLVVAERQIAIDDFETVIQEVTETDEIETATVIRTVAVVNAPEYAEEFAAAPDLLEALEQITNFPHYAYGDNEAACAMVAIASAAIAKAKGEQS